MNKLQLGSAGVSLALVGALSVHASSGAFSDTTDNPDNEFSTGTVVLTDDDGGGTAMFNVANMQPGTTRTKCINVAYAGSLGSTVKLYGAVTGTGLQDYLNLTVERSTGAAGGVTFDCAGFTEAGKSAVWTNASDGDLGTFLTAKTNFGNGADSWVVPGGVTTTASYRFTVTLQDDNNAQNKGATVAFTWEAQDNGPV